jgi:hypothetical protein
MGPKTVKNKKTAMQIGTGRLMAGRFWEASNSSKKKCIL